MFDRKKAKLEAKRNVKSDYVVFVLACLLAAYIGVAHGSTMNYTQMSSLSIFNENGAVFNYDNKTISAETVLDELLTGKVKEGEDDSNTLLIEAENSTFKIGRLEFGRTKGVLSSFINNLNSGKFLVILFQTILSLTKSERLTTSIMIVIVSIVTYGFSIFIKNTYKVAFKRIFLEGHTYDYVKVSRFLFLFRVKKFMKAFFTIFLTSIYQFIWDLSIIGGLIKNYSYAMVAYIVAENPDIDAKDAIELSRRMMYGHKWEMFKLELSFIGWRILGMFTFGLSRILFSNPYEECVYTAYYIYLRKLAKDKGISYAGKLNDEYLYEIASKDVLCATYSDVIEIMNDDIIIDDYIHGGFRGFIENNFGIIYKYDKEEDDFNVAIEQEEKISEYKQILKGKQYPGRLSPIPINQRDPRLEQVHYLRHYSIWSIIAMFFIFSFVGWLWEVSIHLLKDGMFVNRGTMHGPWLPIYGCGCVFILILLYRFRKKPALQSILTISLCGVIEYFTHWYLEVTKGTKWWDYSGYFLNINGRICAEGLLVFMLGGMAVVYVLGPIIDDILRKINRKHLIVVCSILLSIFLVDSVYSHFYPNKGKGITDYDTAEVIRFDKL